MSGPSITSLEPTVHRTDLYSEFARLLSSIDLERRFYQTVIASFPIPVLLVDSDLTIGIVNASFRRLAGLDNSAFYGIPVKEVLRESDFGEAVGRLLESGEGATETACHSSKTNSGYRVRLWPLHGFERDGAVRFMILAEPLGKESLPQDSGPAGETATIIAEALRTFTHHSEMIISTLPLSHPIRRHLIEMQVAVGRIALLQAHSHTDKPR